MMSLRRKQWSIRPTVLLLTGAIPLVLQHGVLAGDRAAELYVSRFALTHAGTSPTAESLEDLLSLLANRGDRIGRRVDELRYVGGHVAGRGRNGLLPVSDGVCP